MSVTLLRESAFFRGFSVLHIYLNDEKVDTITSGEKKELDVPSDGAVLKVSQFGGKSNTLRVYKGDFIHLKVAPWSSWLLILILMFMPIVISYSSNIHSFIPILLLLLVYYLVFSYFETFRLMKDASRKKE